MPALPVSEYAEKINSLDIVYIAGPDDLPLILPTLKAIATSPGPFRGLDTETLGLSPRKHRVRTIQFASETTVLVVDLDAFRSRGEDGSVIRQVDWDAWPALKRLKNYIEQTDKVLTLHNAGFDINMLACEGFKFTTQKIFDTLIASKIINNGTGAKNGLGDVVQRRLGFPLEKELQRSDFSGDLSEEQIRYGALDAVVCVFLAPVLEEVLQSSVLKEGKTLYMVFAMEMACVLAISLMRHVGFGFNVEKAKQLHAELLAEADTKKLAFCEALDAKMRKRRKPGLPRNADGTLNLNKKTCGSIRLGTKVYAGFNPGSTKQLIPAFTAAGVKLSFDSKGKHSLDQNLLAFIRDKVPLVDMYLTWKAISTRASSVESLLAAELDGRIYATYKQLGCQTGRLSCVEPNLQQVPKESEFRGLFIPRPGYKLIVADYGQVELRIVAHLAQEPRMIQAYKDGRDLHRETASLMKKVPYDQVSKSDRSSAKICNFGLIYGAGPATLRKQAMSQYGVLYSLEESTTLVQGFRESYPTLHSWQKEVGTATTASLYTLTGRRRTVVGSFDDRFTVRCNTPVQGTAGDIAKIAIGYIWQEIISRPEGEAELISMVHDELILEAREDVADTWASILQERMEQAGRELINDLPIVAEVSKGDTWAEAK